MKFKQIILVLLGVFLIANYATAEPGRWEKELSGKGWKLWLDHAAVWWFDDLYMPPIDISKIPSNPPTCGWDNIDMVYDKVVNVPGTVEEHYWGEIGGVIPEIGGDYHGVSWWSRKFTLDPDIRGKRITIYVDSVNLRGEIYVNRQLVGYDIVANTPFEFDVTDAVRFDGENRIDIRITDPVGSFNYQDNILYRRGENLIPGVHGL